MPSYLTPTQLENIAALLAHPNYLPLHFAEVVIASAYMSGQTPRAMLEGLLDGYPISDEQWETLVAPELAFALTPVEPWRTL